MTCLVHDIEDLEMLKMLILTQKMRRHSYRVAFFKRSPFVVSNQTLIGRQ